MSISEGISDHADSDCVREFRVVDERVAGALKLLDLVVARFLMIAGRIVLLPLDQLGYRPFWRQAVDGGHVKN